MITFGQRLKELRVENNLRVRDLSDEISITEMAWRYYETDKREPNLNVIRFICKRFNVSADYFLGLSDERTNLSELKKA